MINNVKLEDLINCVWGRTPRVLKWHTSASTKCRVARWVPLTPLRLPSSESSYNREEEMQKRISCEVVVINTTSPTLLWNHITEHQLTSSPPQNRLILDPLLLNLDPDAPRLLLPSRLFERRDRDLRWVEHDPPILGSIYILGRLVTLLDGCVKLMLH